jgi:predicted permease
VKGINIWIPYSMLSQFENESWLMVEVRLNSGYSRADAQAEFRVIAQQQDLLHPRRKTTLIVTNGSVIAEPHLGMAIWIVFSIMGALALVTLISCTNVSALLLSRAAARHERSPSGFRLERGEPAYCWTVFVYLAGITLAAGCLSGLSPIAESLKVDLGTSLKGSESCLACGVRNWRTLDLLIASQMAMSLILLAAAAICVRAQYTMFAAGPGFEIEHVLAVRIDSSADGSAFRRTLGQRLKPVPGVVSVCYAEFLPFEREDAEDVRALGQPVGTGRMVSANFVSPNYFDALGIPIVRGRTFGESDITTDHAAPVAIVSAAFARQFWPGEDALGKVIEVPKRLQIVGVSRDSRSVRYGEQDGPQLFRLQGPKESSGSLMVRFQGDASAVETGISDVLHEMGSGENSRPTTLKWMMDTSSSAFWAIAEMILFLGIAAVGLATVGTYGVAAFAAERRTKEFGIRMALGAVRVDIIHLALRSDAKPIAWGLLAGICMGLGSSHALVRLMENAPFVFDMHDPLAYVCVSILLVSSSTVATIIPALRATTANPIHALREE